MTEWPEVKLGEWCEVKTVDEMQAFYLSRLPAIREAARELGWAIGVHGSTRRDFDLVGLPWREGHADKDALARAVQKAACGFTMTEYRWEQKPVGRMATSFAVCWPTWHGMISAGCIDLSVMTTAYGGVG